MMIHCFYHISSLIILKNGGGGHKFLFSPGQIFCKKLLYHTVAMIGLKHFRIVMYC